MGAGGDLSGADVPVANWVGGVKETHDFYFGSNAVEVKTTSRKEPYSVQTVSYTHLDASWKRAFISSISFNGRVQYSSSLLLVVNLSLIHI